MIKILNHQTAFKESRLISQIYGSILQQTKLFQQKKQFLLKILRKQVVIFLKNNIVKEVLVQVVKIILHVYLRPTPYIM